MGMEAYHGDGAMRDQETVDEGALRLITAACGYIRELEFTDHVQREVAKGELETIEGQVHRLRAYIAGLRDAKSGG